MSIIDKRCFAGAEYHVYLQKNLLSPWAWGNGVPFTTSMWSASPSALHSIGYVQFYSPTEVRWLSSSDEAVRKVICKTGECSITLLTASRNLR